MPEIDLDPKDYRAQPLRGEPVFARGGLVRLAVVVGVIVIFALLNFYVRPYFTAFMGWLRTQVS